MVYIDLLLLALPTHLPLFHPMLSTYLKQTWKSPAPIIDNNLSHCNLDTAGGKKFLQTMLEITTNVSLS